MESEEGGVYVLREEDDETWEQPVPVETAIVDTITDETDLEADDIGTVEEYVERDALADVLDGGEGDELTFDIEDHEVTIDSSGTISVAL